MLLLNAFRALLFAEIDWLLDDLVDKEVEHDSKEADDGYNVKKGCHSCKVLQVHEDAEILFVHFVTLIAPRESDRRLFNALKRLAG